MFLQVDVLATKPSLPPPDSSQSIHLVQLYTAPYRTSIITMAVESKFDPKDMLFRHLGPTGLKVSIFSLGYVLRAFNLAVAQWLIPVV